MEDVRERLGGWDIVKDIKTCPKRTVWTYRFITNEEGS